MTALRRILIIDDSALLLDRLRTRLIAEGWEVVTTTQTVGAAKYLVNCDLVLLDFHMPGIDGGAVVGSLKAATRSGESAPLFYVYTSDDEKAAAYRRYGFDGAITRKGDDEALVQQIGAVFRMRRLRELSRSRI